MKVFLWVVAVLVVLGGLAWYLVDATSQSVVSTTASTSLEAYGLGTTTASTTNTGTAPTSEDYSPTTNIDLSKVMSATLHTSMGDITVEFYPDQAPGTVENFIKLASQGFYDGTKFHRVIKGFMDQGGDPLTKDDSKAAVWGTGGPGYTIPDEFGTKYTNTAGTLAMANTGQPNSGGSQFFINAVDNHFLDGKYTVFGHVTAGMDVVTAINNTPVDGNDRPLTPVVLKSITLQ